MTDQFDSHAAEELRKALRIAVPVETPERVQDRRERLVSVIEDEILSIPAQAAVQEQRRRWSTLAAAAVALLALGVGTSQILDSFSDGHDAQANAAGQANAQGALEGEALVSLHRGEHGTASPTALARGSSIELAKNQRADLVLPGETHMALDEEGQLVLVASSEFSQAVKLTRGRLEVDVKKGEAEHRRVRVLTPHARVEVKGTRFVVRVEPNSDGLAESTSVDVLRGEVMVSFEGGTRTLHRGQSWNSQMLTALHQPSLQADAPAGGSQQSEGASQSAELSLDSVSEASSARSPSSSKTTTVADTFQAESSLSQQNALLEKALRLERSGQARRAESVLVGLLRSYPRSPLRSTIQSELKRLRSSPSH